MSAEIKAHPGMEKPPTTSVGVLGWLHQNLFSSLLNSVLTLISAGILYLLGRGLVKWALTEARWGVITSNIKVLAWGRYPNEEAWRLGISLLIILAMGLLTWALRRGSLTQNARRALLTVWVLSPVAIVILIHGITLPTIATITNNLGYYIYRPELMPLLGEAWRASAALLVLAFVAGLTCGSVSKRTERLLSLAPLLALFLFTLPLGLLANGSLFGFDLPRLLPQTFALLVGFFSGMTVGRALTSIAAIRWLRIGSWVAVLPGLLILLTTFDVGVESVAPVEVLQIIEPNIWSGMMLTILLAVVSIVASFPIGVLLALGRRSSLPVVKGFSVLFIEVVRGVPLITILFMAQVMLPLFLPLELTVDRVIRAMVGMTLFTAAYLAEIVRGGLQAVRNEQVEAARALGLSEMLVTGLIVLPQALRAVIPPIMGQFVSIFKDTTLVTIVGLLDLLAVGQSVIKQREFLGAVREVYLFAGVFYFVISYAMSVASRRLERQLGVTEES
ncbi:MAG: amino acid ABC transporter permease [Anaerolineales bacterium]|nr:amino acid ABC transporter permease [Anaerolineales bacterium]